MVKIGGYKIECDDTLCYVSGYGENRVVSVDNLMGVLNNIAQTMVAEELSPEELFRMDKKEFERRVREKVNELWKKVMQSRKRKLSSSY